MRHLLQRTLLARTSAVLLSATLPIAAAAQTADQTAALPPAPRAAVQLAALSPALAASVDAAGTAQGAASAANAATSAVPNAAPNPTLTRAQAEQMALRANPRITVSRLLALAQGQAVRVARSGEMPQITGSLTAEDGYDGSRIASGALSASRLLNHVGGGVSLSQLITDFGQTRNRIASSRLTLQAQQANTLATRDDVVLVVDQAFYSALRAQAVLQVTAQTVATREATQRQISVLTQNNLRSTLDASFADVDLSQARLLQLDAQSSANSAMAQLDEVLGLNREQPFTLVQDPHAALPPPQDVTPLVQLALAQRPDLEALREQSAAEQKQSRAEWDQNLPTLSALGTVGGTPVRTGRYFLSSWDGAAALNLEVPLFNGFRYSAQASEMKLRAQATDAQSQELRNAIVRDVHTAWLEANTAFARIGVAAQLLRQTNLGLKLAQTRYNLGLSSIVELSQTQLAQTQASIAYTDARYRYRAALAALRFQTGQQP